MKLPGSYHANYLTGKNIVREYEESFLRNKGEESG